MLTSRGFVGQTTGTDALCGVAWREIEEDAVLGNGWLPQLGVLALLGGAIWFAASLMASWDRQGRNMVKHWAEDNGYQLVSLEHRVLNRGPFGLSTSRMQMIYSLVVMDESGLVRQGWARCGGWFAGVASGQIDVRLGEPVAEGARLA
jgi:hypothetical protein